MWIHKLGVFNTRDRGRVDGMRGTFTAFSQYLLIDNSSELCALLLRYEAFVGHFAHARLHVAS
jgi:hypothetical protein